MRRYATWNEPPPSGCVNPTPGLSSKIMESMYAFVMNRLQGAKGRWREVANGSGVSLRTLEKIARKEIDDPGVSHIEKLNAYFRNNNREHCN